MHNNNNNNNSVVYSYLSSAAHFMKKCCPWIPIDCMVPVEKGISAFDIHLRLKGNL
jgi:hypothetical protein